ncbi:replication restart DNA helicase PriA [Prevotellaceae bacterium HUN156]|nr:replication restart DNA helicase PriA [Prevotellaceae bacterium HUN156]
MQYADIILPVPLYGTFTYAVPEGMSVGVGMRVLVPFGRSKSYVGVVMRLHDQKPTGYEVKVIQVVMDKEPVVMESQLRLWQWISDYYLSPIGDVYKAALPAGLKAEEGYRPKTETYVRLTAQYRNVAALHIALNVLSRAKNQLNVFTEYLALSHWDEMENGVQPEEVTREELMNVSGGSAATLNQLVKRQLLECYEVEVGRLNHGGPYRPELVKPLSAAQQDAYNKIQLSMLKKRVTLLHGVTSSGKTEIYIHLIQQALERKEQVLFLMPEIALTVQMMQRLQRVFGDRLGIYHSRYSDAERVEIWQKQLSANPYDVILGARSAVFLPFQRLGLVIVDEEHETSYKQQDPAPRYHARNTAIMLGAQSAPLTPHVLLGTATPSLESYHNAKTGKYGLVELTERYQGIELPEIQVVDTADLQHRKMMIGPFSPLLLTRMREALERGEQVILFQNRRGFAPVVECRQCGWVPTCQHCDVSLTYHRQLNQLTCHYCGFTYRVPTECPCCGSTDLRTRGYGTEKIEEQVREAFPEARIARMDLDTTRTRNAYERIISDFSAGRTNILIGTQMISKGLDFDKVSVVGIINADGMLNYPDFRAYEHAFMMMAQVSGRAGRKNKRGLVILQTKQKDLPVIHQVVRNDYIALYKDLIAERQAFRYPPYYRLIYVFLRHRQDSTVNTAAIELGSRLRQWFSDRVLGPDKPAVAKVKSQNIRKLVLKLELGIDMKKVREYLLLAQSQILADKRYSTLQVYYDVDPL